MKIHSITQKYITAVMVTVVMCFGVLSFTPSAHAQTYANEAEHRAALIAQIQQLMKLIQQLLELKAQMDFSQNPSSTTDGNNLVIISFSHKTPTNAPTELHWSAENAHDCSLYHAGPRRLGLLEESVGTQGKRQVALTFPNGYDYVKFELRCSVLSERETIVSKYVKIDRREAADSLLAQFADDLNDAFRVDYKKKAINAYSSATEELEELAERYEDVESVAQKQNIDDDIATLFATAEAYIDEADKKIDDEEYEAAFETVEQASEILDAINDKIDDLEDGRIAGDFPVITSTALIRVNGASPLTYLEDGETYEFMPWDTPLFRWDHEFDFDDSTICYARLQYSGSTLRESYQNSATSRDRIGFYAPIVSEYGSLSGLSVECESDTDEFSASVDIDIDGPEGTRTFNAFAGTRVYGETNRVSYTNSLARCYEYSYRLQRDTKCVWGNDTIADIRTRGEGVQGLGVFFDGYDTDTQARANVDRAVVIGAYEGTYPDGVQHSFGYHPQGEVTVYLPDGGSHVNMLLVLTAYEPVKWNITGPGVKNVGEVLATGYYNQEVVGLASDIYVKMTSNESGNEYNYAHSNTSRNFGELKKRITEQYGVTVTQFHGAYSQDRVTVGGYKG